MTTFHWKLTIVCAAVLVGGCGTVDLGPSPADINACRPSATYFYEQVWPNVLAKDYGGKRCADARCHDASSGRQLVLAPAPTSAPMVPLPEDWARVYKSVTEQMSCTNVTASPILRRTDGRQTHGGGKLIEPEGPEATIIKMWVEAP